jgi:CheY-like chemotaxis protein
MMNKNRSSSSAKVNLNVFIITFFEKVKLLLAARNGQVNPSNAGDNPIWKKRHGCTLWCNMAICMPERAVILLAEDEEDYVLLLRRALSEAGVQNPLQVVSTGVEAIAYLKGEGKYGNRAEYPLPDLMLLDIKLPGYSGLEVLGWMRSQPGLSSLRVLMLTSSEQLRDVNDAYRLGANSFLLKPYDFTDLVQLAKVIQEYWLYISKTPESFRSPSAPLVIKD